MKYELAHDTIARHVFDKASADTKARRQARLLVERALERYRSRGVLLTQDDLDEIRPYERLITFDAAEKALIQRSQRALAAAARRRRRIATAISITLATLLVIAVWQWQAALRSARAQQRMRLALQADRALDEGWPSTAYRLAASAYAPANAAATQTIIDSVLNKLTGSGLVADLQHNREITAMDFSPSGKTILTASLDGTVRLWDTAGALLRTIVHGQGPVYAAQLLDTPDGLALLSAGEDGAVRLWDTSATLLQEYLHPAPVRLLNHHPSQGLFLTVAEDEHLRLFDLKGKQVNALIATDSIVDAAFSPRGDYLLLASTSQVIVKAVAAGGRVLLDRFEYSDTIRKADFIQSDYFNLATLIVTPSGLRILDSRGQIDTLSDYRFLNTLLESNRKIIDVTFSHQPRNPQPKTLFIFSDTLVQWWTFGRKGDEFKPVGVMDFAVNPRAAVTWAGFSATDRRVAIASGTNWVELWDLEQEKTAHRFKAKVDQATFAPDDRFLLTLGPENCARLWALERKPASATPIELIDYFDSRLRALTPAEENYYQLR